ncbi:MAG: lipocalin-like domain-containing protein [Saprospiraceae bacterium]|nr:lipocalin-like domain-containing protein [Saprospiraceae bacterium]
MPVFNLANEIQGTWWLESRVDVTVTGTRVIDPTLGEDPIAILVYAGDHFAAQFMKRDRTEATISQITTAGLNNTAAVGGYDAYFGTFRVDKDTSLVAHTLIGSINPSNIGLTVQRQLTVEGGKLIIRLDTTTSDGNPIVRTLTWNRLS